MTWNASIFNRTTAALGPNSTAQVYTPYELVWTTEVVLRVSMLVIVMVFTLVGNTTLILLIMIKRKRRRKRVNVFLVNLAFGDLTVCFVTMTVEVLFIAFGEWVLGAAACKLMVYGQMVTLASATFLLTAMSIDRYQVIVKPLQSLRGSPKIWRKVLIAWILAFIFASPQLMIFVEKQVGTHPDGTAKNLCLSRGYTAKWQRKVYFTFLTLYIMVVPTIIMSFCYMNIIRVVWRRTFSGSSGSTTKSRGRSFRNRIRLRRDSDGCDTPERLLNRRRAVCQHRFSIPEKLVSSSKRNVIKMTLSVIIGFIICWCPYFILSLIRIYSDYKVKLTEGLAVAEIMGLVHSALNPMLYGFFNTRWSLLMKKLWCRNRAGREGSGMDREASSDDETTFSDARYTEQDRRSSYFSALMEKLPFPFLHHSPRMRVRQDENVVRNYHFLIPNGHFASDDASEGQSANKLTSNQSIELQSTSARVKEKASKGEHNAGDFPLVIENPHADRVVEYVSAV